jgi:hypothetical protein
MLLKKRKWVHLCCNKRQIGNWPACNRPVNSEPFGQPVGIPSGESYAEEAQPVDHTKMGLPNGQSRSVKPVES